MITVSLDQAWSCSDSPTSDPAWKLMSLTGWWDGAPVATDEDDVPDADGSFPGLTFRRGRKVSINGMVTSATATGLKYTAAEALAGLSPLGNAMALLVADDDDPGVSKTMQVQLDAQPQFLQVGPRAASFIIPLFAADPRKYGPPQPTPTIYPGGVSSNQGLVFPLFSATGGVLSFGTYAPSGTLSLTNAGTAPSYPVFTVQGLFTGGFSITSGSNLLSYTTTVPAGASVVLSPYAGGRAYQGGSDVTANLVSAQWAPVLPGQTVSYVLNALGSFNANANMTVQFSQAWW